jgi:hypothetical protein
MDEYDLIMFTKKGSSKMDELIVLIKKNAPLLGFIIGALLVGTRFDPRKIVIFGKKKDEDKDVK